MNTSIKKVVTGAAAVVGLIPTLAFAQQLNAGGGVGSNTAANTSTGIALTITTVGNLLGMLIPIILTLAIIYFMWGVLQYVTKGKDASGQAEARNTMLWGIIAIAVMVSIWGLVGILRDTFNISDNGTIPVPHLAPTQ